MTESIADPETTDTDLAPNDRRAMLRKLAIGGAGAAAGVVLLSNGRVSAGVEGQAEDSLELGAAQTNTSVTPTTLVHDPAAARPAGPSSLSVAGAVPAADAPFPGQVGGYGNADVANGLHGSTDQATGFGVVAANLAPAAATATDPVPTGLAVASLGGAQIRFVPLTGAVTGPTPGDHVAGELYADAVGTLWFTVPAPTTTDATAVRFVKLAGTPTAGAFHAIDPQRVYDSRQAAYTVKGVLAPNTNRVVSVADGRNESGTVTLAERRASRRHRRRDQPDCSQHDRPELPAGHRRRQDNRDGVTAQLGSWRHPDRQLGHCARRRRARDQGVLRQSDRQHRLRRRRLRLLPLTNTV